MDYSNLNKSHYDSNVPQEFLTREILHEIIENWINEPTPNRYTSSEILEWLTDGSSKQCLWCKGIGLHVTEIADGELGAIIHVKCDACGGKGIAFVYPTSGGGMVILSSKGR